MSGLFDYIRDYENQHQYQHRSQYQYQYQYQIMRGGVDLDDAQKAHIESILSTIDHNMEGYEDLKQAAEKGTLPNTYANYDAAMNALNTMVTDSAKLKQDTEPIIETSNQIEILESPVTPDTTALLALPPDETGQEIAPITAETNNNNTPSGPVAIYDVIEPGTILYHPSQDVSRFDNSMLFVDVTKVLNKNEQRSFCMFFTPNEEYARRYSGLWSLNKRPVYLHKLKVKEGKPITGIKVIDARIVPSNIDNLDLAKRISGPSEDGTINGIKIEQKLDNSPSVDEYYICNPEIWFDLVETWMQFGSTEWVKITKENVRTIQVPQNEI